MVIVKKSEKSKGGRGEKMEEAMLHRARPPREGVVLREVYDIKEIPKHFFQVKSGSQSLSAFLQGVTSVQCYGIFFGYYDNDAQKRAYFNFFVSGDDRFGICVGLLSRRPFSEGGRHITVRCLEKKSKALWKKVHFWALRVGRIASFVRRLYETVLSPDGPVFKRVRLRFENMAASQL